MTTRTRTRWRGRIAAALGVVALTALGVPSAPQAGAHDSPVLPPGDYTEEQMTQAEELVHHVEQVLPGKFADWQTLEAMGFYDFGVNTPNGYRHFINPSWMADDHLLDPEFAESLVYKDHGGGHLVLEAAMFYLKPEHTMENIPAEYAWLPGWHIHEELCVDENGRFSGINIPGEGCRPAGEPSWSPPMMHVWIVDNECGHRFTGLGVTGAMCDVEGEHGGHGSDPTAPPGPGPAPAPGPDDTPPPAVPIVDEPDFNG